MSYPKPKRRSRTVEAVFPMLMRCVGHRVLCFVAEIANFDEFPVILRSLCGHWAGEKWGRDRYNQRCMHLPPRIYNYVASVFRAVVQSCAFCVSDSRVCPIHHGST